MAKNPYAKYGLQTPKQIRAQDAAARQAYETNLRNQAAQQTAANNQAFDKQQNANYINYMMAQKAMPEQMARMGLTGGATESSIVRMNTNYANTRGNTEAQRNTANTGITTQLNNTLANYKLQQDQLLNDKLAQNQSNLYQRKIDAKERTYQRKQHKDETAYARMSDRVGRYGTVKDINKRIKEINKTLKKKKTSKAKKASLRREKSLLKAQRSYVKGNKK